jgi:hypothetical protein
LAGCGACVPALGYLCNIFLNVLGKILRAMGLRDPVSGDPGKILRHKDLRVKYSGIRT